MTVNHDEQTANRTQSIILHNPDPRDTSHWRTRERIAVLAVIGFSIAGYLTAYQTGFVREVWEPFFGRGSARVLHSFVSKILPVPDALVGMIGYAVEFVSTLLGSAERWRSSPGLVLIYGAIVAAVGCAGLILIAVQAFVLHAFCTLCLASAIISLLIAFLACGEVFASLELLYEKRKTS
jgi:hypothetical protein